MKAPDTADIEREVSGGDGCLSLTPVGAFVGALDLRKLNLSE